MDINELIGKEDTIVKEVNEILQKHREILNYCVEHNYHPMSFFIAISNVYFHARKNIKKDMNMEYSDLDKILDEWDALHE